MNKRIIYISFIVIILIFTSQASAQAYYTKEKTGLCNAYVDAGYAVADTAQAAQAVKDAQQQLDKIKKLNKQGKATDKAVQHAQANLAAATTNLGIAAIKAAEAAANAAGAASTSMGTGLYADLRIDAETTETKTAEQTTKNLASSLIAGKNITIAAGENITQKGSITIAKTGDITYNTGQNLEITASQDNYDYASASQTKTASLTIGSTNPNALLTNDIGGGIGYGTETQTATATTNNNSGVTAAQGKITIKTGNNADIAGANLLAKEINAEIAGDLTVESLQDQHYSYGNSNNFNIGYNTGSGASIGAGYGKNNANSQWTTKQTTIIGTTGVNIQTQGETKLIGSLIANINENGIDTGNLALNAGILTYANLNDYDTSQNTGFSLNLSDIKTEKNNNENHITGNAQIAIKNTGHQTEQTTQATIGAGTITTDSDTTDLNRDITQTQTVTKDTITAALDAQTDFDLRLLSEAGRNEIADELKTAPDNIIDNAWILSGGSKDTALTIAGAPEEFIEAAVIGMARGKTEESEEKITKKIIEGIIAQYNTNIQQVKDSFALRANIAKQTDFLNSLTFLTQEIPIIGNFIPTPATGNLYGNLVIVDTGGIYNNKDDAELKFEVLKDIMELEKVSYPIIHVPYTEGTITEVALEILTGYKTPGLQWANSVISNPNIKEGDTIILNSHSGGALKSSIGSNYLIINNNGIIKQFANQSPAIGYFYNIDDITKNYTFGDIISEGGKILSPLYKTTGEEEIKELIPSDTRKPHNRLDTNILNENIKEIKEIK